MAQMRPTLLLRCLLAWASDIAHRNIIVNRPKASKDIMGSSLAFLALDVHSKDDFFRCLATTVLI